MNWTLPPGACDTHMHFYDPRVPSAPGGPPLPGCYTVADYRALQHRLGLQRVVVVQPNAYQFDNSVMLAALAELGANARGVAVTSADTSDAQIEAMTLAGVRGQRFYALRWGALGLDALAPLMPRLHAHGWHANIQLDGHVLTECAGLLTTLPGDFVIDHVGKFLPPPKVDDPAFTALLRLLDTGRCWVKLSAPYESSTRLSGTRAFDDVAALVGALVAHAPQQLLWATNWPHPFPPAGFNPDDRALLSFFLDCVPREQDRRRILADNPGRLYGFG
ncbi:amidohydrolase family protein [Paraburkholderia susongensis]|uniref:D-galactarolactone isomerase n=1 Tax=Paraburkholderia susongensis TaxID=1515439 RepID=A0A1X7KS26_9BURK|nr:amidohydrolase family protein [Paraburkholderia susongensis]SMG44393.1 D-galactarolactone isomerase [Paraburkholderia susongensis]